MFTVWLSQDLYLGLSRFKVHVPEHYTIETEPVAEGCRESISFKYPGHLELESLGLLSIQDRSTTATAMNVPPTALGIVTYSHVILGTSAIVYITGFLWVIITIVYLSQG